jgi:hypothetical protein
VTFYLGTHMTCWLGRMDVPLFVSHRRLNVRKALPVARCDWALDSGGFTELKMYGRWETLPRYYAERAEFYQEKVGRLKWAAIQDWMCEPFVLQRTGRTLAEHQSLTIDSCHALRALAPSVPWAPVLQGFGVDDYLSHAEQYRESGIDLALEPIVGVGSVCRRQATGECVAIFSALHRLGLKLHGFGLKIEGVSKCWPYLASSDSLAWSARARRGKPLAGCSHANYANCPRYAVQWRERVLSMIGRTCQLSLL